MGKLLLCLFHVAIGDSGPNDPKCIEIPDDDYKVVGVGPDGRTLVFAKTEVIDEVPKVVRDAALLAAVDHAAMQRRLDEVTHAFDGERDAHLSTREAFEVAKVEHSFVALKLVAATDSLVLVQSDLAATRVTLSTTIEKLAAAEQARELQASTIASLEAERVALQTRLDVYTGELDDTLDELTVAELGIRLSTLDSSARTVALVREARQNESEKETPRKIALDLLTQWLDEHPTDHTNDHTTDPGF